MGYSWKEGGDDEATDHMAAKVLNLGQEFKSGGVERQRTCFICSFGHSDPCETLLCLSPHTPPLGCQDPALFSP